METYCNDCPRRCGVVRAAFWDEKKMPGFCHSPLQPVVARGLAPVGRTLYQRQPRLWRRLFHGLQPALLFLPECHHFHGRDGRAHYGDKLRELYGRLIAQGAQHQPGHADAV